MARSFVVFALLAMFVVAMTAQQQPAKCSPWLGRCHSSDDCCRHLVCMSYRAKCVPQSGAIIPGQDQRPIGDGPYPPGFNPNQ